MEINSPPGSGDNWDRTGTEPGRNDRILGQVRSRRVLGSELPPLGCKFQSVVKINDQGQPSSDIVNRAERDVV